MHGHKSSTAVSIHNLFGRVHSLRHNRHVRDASGQFVIEGVRQFVQARDAGFEFDTIIHSPVLLRTSVAQKAVRRLRAAGIRCVTVTPETFRHPISTTRQASGIAAIAKQRWTPLSRASPHRGLGWLIIEHLRSRGNLGTIFRTAEAVGMSGVCFVGHACDPYEPGVVRASMGGIFHLPIVRSSPGELSRWLATNDVYTVGLAPRATRLWIDLPKTAGGRGSVALVLGEERQGLSPTLHRLCDDELRLPMTGRADSINVAVAAGVVIYELVRRAIATGGQG